MTFADKDIRVVAVSDGNQAIARVEEEPPDIVLADVGMPGKSGYEVSSYIKHHPRLAHIPVLLLTGAFEPIDQQKAADAGCDGVLAKPFEPQLVIGRVKELLSRPRATAAPPRSVSPGSRSTAVAPADGQQDTWDLTFPAQPIDDLPPSSAFSRAGFERTPAPPAPTGATPALPQTPVPASVDTQTP